MSSCKGFVTTELFHSLHTNNQEHYPLRWWYLNEIIIPTSRSNSLPSCTYRTQLCWLKDDGSKGNCWLSATHTQEAGDYYACAVWHKSLQHPEGQILAHLPVHSSSGLTLCDWGKSDFTSFLALSLIPNHVVKGKYFQNIFIFNYYNELLTLRDI